VPIKEETRMGAGHGQGHGHGHVHGHAGADHRWRLAAAFGLVAAFFVVELVYALISGSLALLSDAGHMAADVVALGAALAATKIATRQDRSGRRTYGSYRAEVFASGFTVLLMLLVAGYVVYEAVARIGEDVSIQTGPMLLVGGVGLVVNVLCLLLLRGGADASLNVKSAYLEVVADAAGSIGVLVAGVLVVSTDQAYWDTVVALAIGIFVAFRAVVLGREVLAVLGQHVPRGMDITAVVRDLTELAGVADVHDLHAWTLTSGMTVATAHLVLASGADPQDVLGSSQQVLRERHHIEHATLQVEAQPTRQCHETGW